MADKSEHNFVADAHNFEQRIKVENEAAMIWNHNWGSLYSAGEPLTYEGKIAKLEAELKKIPAAALATNNMMSYHGDKAFPEPKWQSFGKKTFGKFESFGDFEEKLDPKYKPTLN
ncbi:hypothetical protein TrCOL_g6543 [Triparma columacea]|uniref:Uncharacterized protein n=1 Tax=Triparma columacea TaxID=722753 RepID=A0A9W7LCV6_9STRA|nr:hypothetical protein TrCOL_g6543 [Triparma columacea]